jgi:hypothetical protein
VFVGGRVKEEEGRAFVDYYVEATSEEKEETTYRSEGRSDEGRTSWRVGGFETTRSSHLCLFFVLAEASAPSLAAIISGTGVVLGTTVTGTREPRTSSSLTEPSPATPRSAFCAAPKPREPHTTASASFTARSTALAALSLGRHRTMTLRTRAAGIWHSSSCARWKSRTRSPSSCGATTSEGRRGGRGDVTDDRGDDSFWVPRPPREIFARSFFPRRWRESDAFFFFEEAHPGVGRRRLPDRGDEIDVRVAVDDVLRGVTTRAHRPGTVVRAHGDAPAASHRDRARREYLIASCAPTRAVMTRRLGNISSAEIHLPEPR